MSTGDTQSRQWRAQPPQGKTAHREWRGVQKRATSRISRRFKLAAVGLLLTTLASVILFLFLVPGPGALPLQVITFGIGAYGGRKIPQPGLPANPYGETDAEAFNKLSERDPRQFPSVVSGRDALSGEALRQFLQTQVQDVAGRNLVVFFTMHGLVQPGGEIELLAIDATPESPESGSRAIVRLNELLAQLRECRASRVVLALDCAHLDSHWRLGLLTNDIAAQLERTLADEPQLSNKISILLAAGPGQRSRGAEGQSAFARFLLEGLEGAADGWTERPNGPKFLQDQCDRRVSLLELSRFVSSRVSDWSQSTSGQEQKILLMGNRSDFPLAEVSPPAPKTKATPDKTPELETAAKGSTPPAPAGTAAGTPPAEKPAPAPAPAIPIETRIAGLWKAHQEFAGLDEASTTDARHRAPYAWRTFEAQLRLVVALQTGRSPQLAQAVTQAELLLKKFQTQAASFADDPQLSRELQSVPMLLGFSAGRDKSRDPEAVALAGQFAQSLLIETPAPTTPPNEAPKAAAPPAKPPTPAAIQEWFLQELTDPVRGVDPVALEKLRRIHGQLLLRQLWPESPEGAVMAEVLNPPGAESLPRGGKGLKDLLEIRRRLVALAARSPESLPLIEQDVQLALRALDAAERWLVAAGPGHPEVAKWQAEALDRVERAEQRDRQFSETTGLLSDLLAELPGVAEWVAARAADDQARPIEGERLRTLAKLWRERQRDQNWNAEELISLWPAKPTRLTDLERQVLKLLIDAQRCRSALMRDPAELAQSSETDWGRLADEVGADRKELWRTVRNRLPVQGTAVQPSPTAWRDAERVLAQPWLTTDERRLLEALHQQHPAGTTANADPKLAALWQGFFALATLSLLDSGEQMDRLWENWEDLVIATEATPDEANVLRRHRLELGRAIRLQWKRLQSDNETAGTSVAAPYLATARLDPGVLTARDPDAQLQAQRRQALGRWLFAFSNDWRRRAPAREGWSSKTYLTLADSAEQTARKLEASSVSDVPASGARFQELPRIAFNPERRGTFVVATTGAALPGMRLLLPSAPLRLLHEGRLTLLDQALELPFPASGELSLELELDSEVTATTDMLIALADADGFPLEFRRLALQPPFDPTTWRVQFVDAEKGQKLRSDPLPGGAGSKLFLPPSAAFAIRAELVRPDKDVTPSAKVTVYRLTENGRVELLPAMDITFQPGNSKTPLPFPVPVSKDAALVKEADPVSELATLDRGWEFEITPAGEQPLLYRIQPTFWSDEKFIKTPRVEVRGNQLTFVVERLPAESGTSETSLLPQAIEVELHVPLAWEKRISGRTLSGMLEYGQRLDLGLTMPADWSEDSANEPLEIALDVAGLPHAWRWQITPTGIVTRLVGQPSQIAIHLPARPKEDPLPPTYLRQGKDALKLEFQVDSAELNRTTDARDWRLSYRVFRVTESGSQLALPGTDWRLTSSLAKQVRLTGMQQGVWQLTTAATDYTHEVSAQQLGSSLGRFRIEAELHRGESRVAFAALPFVIDDDAEPQLKVSGIAGKPLLVNKDFTFKAEAADAESGIVQLTAGFDQNGDKQLQDDERSLIQGFDNWKSPKADWTARISTPNLPKLKQDEEERVLLVQATNGLGKSKTEPFVVTFRKDKKATTGTIAVSFPVYRGARGTVQLTGPKAVIGDAATGSATFRDLPPGQYQIKVDVNYAVVGRREAGGGTVEVTAGRTTSVKISLTTPK